MNGGNELTIFAVVRLKAVGSYPELLTYFDALNELRWATSTGQVQLVYNVNAITGTVNEVNVWVKQTAMLRNDTTMQAWVQGASLGTGTCATPTTGQTLSVGSRAGLSLFANMDLAALLIYNVRKNATEQAKIEGYLAAKYGV